MWKSTLAWFKKRLRFLKGASVKDDVGRIYFESALARFRAVEGLHDCADDDVAKATIKDLLEKYKADPDEVSLCEALIFERMIVRVLPSSRLAASLFQTRMQFKQLVTADEYQEYVKRPADAQKPEEAQVRSEIDELLEMIHKTYLFVPFREHIRTRVSRRLTTGLCISVAIILAVIICLKTPPPLLIVVLLGGALGGMLSVQFRVQSIPTDGDAIRGSLSISNSLFGVYFSPVVGAVSAVILYLMFRGNLISGNLFPDFAKYEQHGVLTTDFVLATSLAPVDLAKLILWSFIAGFIERLVPDTVTRLSEALSSQKFSNSQNPGTSVVVAPGRNDGGKPS